MSRVRFFAFFCIFLFLIFPICSQSQSLKSARAVAEEAAKKATVSESIEFLKNAIPRLPSGAEKRSATAFLGAVLEQSGLFAEAQKAYADAAAMKASDAAGMPKKSSEQLVIDAIRCALSLGDSATADNFLRSDVKKSKDEKIIAYTKLYEQWSALCKAQNTQETKGAISTLSSFVSQKSMKSVTPTVLLTLWHITGEESWAAKLKKEYPSSLETSVVKGQSQQLPTPFWYFVPRNGADIPEIAQEGTPTSQAIESSEVPKQMAVKEQIGLFKNEENAKRLVEKLKVSGFAAKIDVETRSNGVKYYLVYVPENATGTMGNLLRAAGFECYPLF